MGIELEYIVPEEGSNVWFDGWCIPKYAKNEKAASWFINYMCIPENAIKNMDFIGYVSVIATPEVREWVDDEEEWDKALDLTYFFGEDAKAVHANPVLYADKAIIERCALMHDAGEMNEELIKMWNRVKGDNLSPLMLAVITIVLLLIIIFAVVQVLNNRKQQKLQHKHRNKR
jgi:spermidine/putrescine transport system substrate-binding protein